MSFRGRGRGRGYGGGGFRFAKQEQFVLFPEIDLPNAKDVKEEVALVVWSSKLQRFWSSSPYNYEGVGEGIKKKESKEIERFSDKDVKRGHMKPPLRHFIKMTDEYVPAELAEGAHKARRSQKRVRWNPESDFHKLDLFEKLERKSEGNEEKGEKEKKEEDEDDDDERVEEEDEELSDDGDYNQNIDFDDDEDDFNMADDNDDEPMF